MIEYRTGDILSSSANIIVIPVNCVGVMGAGLALQFKKSYPFEYEKYIYACSNGLITTGNPSIMGKWCLFPTKHHWKNKSELWYIQLGLSALDDHILDAQRRTIAFPKLGCGLGGLDWKDVKPLIIKFAENRPTDKIEIWE